MVTVRDALLYLVSRYPHKHELSRSRLMSMLYLADWKSTLGAGHEPLTSATWALGTYGPYSEEVYEVMQDATTFRIVMEENVHGTAKGRVEAVDGGEEVARQLDQRAKAVLNFVVETTRPLRWTDFVGLLNSTYPLLAASDAGDVFDLPQLARDYLESQPLLRA